MQKNKLLQDVTNQYTNKYIFPNNITVFADKNNNDQLYLQNITDHGIETMEKINDIPLVYLIREDKKYCFSCSSFNEKIRYCTNHGRHSHCWTKI